MLTSEYVPNEKFNRFNLSQQLNLCLRIVTLGKDSSLNISDSYLQLSSVRSPCQLHIWTLSLLFLQNSEYGYLVSN